jgi:hypothetical protein
MKDCGCRAGGLTRNVTIWHCPRCQTPNGGRARRCRGADCDARKPANPRGFGCCDATWHEGQACGTCGRVETDPDLIMGCSDLNPFNEHLAPNVCRGSFQDRRGITRCVGCLKEETPTPA